ncbi:macro domain-containing protein [Weissella confusa]
MKVSPWDSHLIQSVLAYSGWVFGIIGTLLSFKDFSEKTRSYILLGFGLFVVILYIAQLIKSNVMRKIGLKIDDSTVTIEEGDIFDEKWYNNHDYIKVFAFNEYFDTVVDNEIISASSLNGQFLNKKVSNINLLNQSIENDGRLNSRYRVGNVDYERFPGKNTKYQLGSIHKYSEDVFLTALTHFDEKNRAYLSIQDYIKFLVNFWDEIDELYAGRTVVITLFGSGITRLDHNRYTATQILDTVLWTFKLRRIKFKKPTRLVILLDKDTNKQINYFLLRGRFYCLQK